MVENYSAVEVLPVWTLRVGDDGAEGCLKSVDGMVQVGKGTRYPSDNPFYLKEEEEEQEESMAEEESGRQGDEGEDEVMEDVTATTAVSKATFGVLEMMTQKVDWTDPLTYAVNSDMSTPLELISWSSDNMIAFTGDSRYFDGAMKNIYMKPERQIIYIMRADIPHEYTLIKTSHLSPIKSLQWANQSSPGSILMSTDKSDKICLWKIKDNTDEWMCTQSFQVQYLLLAKWVTINPIYSPILNPCINKDYSPQSSQYLKDQFRQSAENPTQIFITLSKLGKLTIGYFNILEANWKQISSSISLPLNHSIDCAEIFSSKDDHITIATYSKKLKNFIILYKVNFDIHSNYNQINIYQFDKINLSNIIQDEKVLLGLKKSLVVSHIVFDNSINSLIVLMKGYNNTCILYRWEKKETEQNSMIFGLFDGTTQPMIIEEWTCTATRSIQSRGSKYPPVSSIHYSSLSGLLWLNYSYNEKIELVDRLTFSRISVIDYKSYKDNDGLDINLSMTSSPNGCLMAALTSNYKVKVFTCALTKNTSNNTLKNVGHWLNHSLQNSILRSSDWWDILVTLKIYSTNTTYKPLIPGQNTKIRNTLFHDVIINLTRDYSEFSPSIQVTYRSTIDSIKASIYRMVEGMEGAYVDSQAKSFIYYFYDTLKSTYPFLSKDHYAGYAQLSSESFIRERENILILIDWVIEFSIFFCKSIYILSSHFLKDMDSQFNIPESIKDHDFKHFYPFLFWQSKASNPKFTVPTVSLIFDFNLIMVLIELLIYSKIYKEKTPATNQNNPIKIKYPSTKEISDVLVLLQKLVQSLLFKMGSGLEIQMFDDYNNKIYQSILHDNPIDLVTFTMAQVNSNNIANHLAVLREFKNTQECITFQSYMLNTSNESVNNSYSFLDLDPPLDGFLDQNPINFQENSKSYFQYLPKSSEFMSLAYDIITRIPLPVRIDKPFKKCTRCHRITVVLRTSVLWSDRWSLACPLCGGRFKL